MAFFDEEAGLSVGVGIEHAAGMWAPPTVVALVVMLGAAVGAPLPSRAGTTSSTVNATIPDSNDAVEVETDIPYYVDGPTLDAYLPKGTDSDRPALILVHGGGWNSGDKAEFAPYAMQAATEQRWAVFDVNYRLSATDPAAWPDELHDVQAAIRFVVDNSTRFGIDPTQVIALGESAGANLLALVSQVGTAEPITGDAVGVDTEREVRLRAVALWSPPVDLADLYSNGGEAPAGCGDDEACDFTWSQGAVAEYVGCPPSSCPATYAEASPLSTTAGQAAASFVVNSTDELVPVAQVQQYVTQLDAANVDTTFVELPGDEHGLQYGQAVWPDSVAFLGRHLDDPSGTNTSTSSSTRDVWPTIAGILGAAGVLVLVALTLRRMRSGAHR